MDEGRHEAAPPIGRAYGPGKRASWRTIVALTLVGVTAVLLVSEVVVLPRVLGLPRDLALLGFASNARKVDDTPINALGFTGDVPEALKRPGTKRILTLGGSSMFNRRLTERLKARIEKVSGEHVEVLGAAMRTQTSRADLIKYRFLSKYRFDDVLIYEGINDLWANHVEGSRFRMDYAHLDPWYDRNFPLESSLVARVLFNWTHPDGALALRLKQDPRAVVNGADYRSAQALEANLRELIADVRADGGTPILITFAWAIPQGYTRAAFTAGTLGYVNPDSYEAFPVELWGPVEFVREGLRRHDEVVRRLARELHVPLLDEQQRFAGHTELFGDVCHFNEAGTEAFVSDVAEFLKGNGLI